MRVAQRRMSSRSSVHVAVPSIITNENGGRSLTGGGGGGAGGPPPPPPPPAGGGGENPPRPKAAGRPPADAGDANASTIRRRQARRLGSWCSSADLPRRSTSRSSGGQIRSDWPS